MAESSPAERVRRLIDRGFPLVETDPEGARELFMEALGLVGAGGMHEEEGRALYGLGECARVSWDYPLAIDKYAEALKHAEHAGVFPLKGRCLRRLGDMHYFLTSLDLALKYYLRAIRVYEDLSLSEESSDAQLQEGHLLSAIGNVLKLSGDLNGSMDYYRRSLDVYRELEHAPCIPGVSYNIATVMQERGRLDEAEKAYTESLLEARKRDDEYLISLTHNSLGSVCLAKGEYEEAEEHFRTSLATSEGMNRKSGILMSLMKLQELHRIKGEPEEALDLTAMAEELAAELGDRGKLGEILREKARVQELAGDHRGAYESLRGFVDIQKEQLSEKRLRRIDVLRLYYETEERERKIEQLNLANLELARAYSEAEELTRTDALTGLGNRRAALEWLAHRQEQYKRTGSGFSLILADIDRFKSCNDSFGHEVGDAVLVQLAERMNRAIRKNDLAVRWGGEEFLILLPETDTEDAALVADNLRKTIQAEPFQVGEHSIPLTMTFGLCQGGCTPVEAVIRSADRAMYRGKHLGRNRVEISRPRA
ncbi:MAG TPA: diguanylate cyclase [Candidatus Sabulitectum sp.]|nr:diguanylate cyclase [Candidatus Sabulitectum sp.]